MLRYIYLLCLINFELVFCYSSIHSGKIRRSEGARVRKRQYASDDSPLTNIDVVSFMQKPEEAEDEPYIYESKRRRSKYDYLPLEEPTPRQRRLSRPLPDDWHNARSTLPAHQRDQHSRQLPKHPKRKCSFAHFPFFSHKNKTKPEPSPTPKLNKRKSHFFKSKLENRSSIVPDNTQERQMKFHRKAPEQITPEPKHDGTTAKRMSPKAPRAKKSLPKMIHNSRQYFANRFRLDNDTYDGVMKIKNDSKRERVRSDNTAYEGNNERESARDEATGEKIAQNKLMSQQKEQQKVLEELENRLRESYHVLRNLFK